MGLWQWSRALHCAELSCEGGAFSDLVAVAGVHADDHGVDGFESLEGELERRLHRLGIIALAAGIEDVTVQARHRGK